MVSYGRIDNATVEEDFGGVGDAIKHLESFIKLLAVIVGQGLHPCLNFLPELAWLATLRPFDRINVPVSMTSSQWQHPRFIQVDGETEGERTPDSPEAGENQTV